MLTHDAAVYDDGAFILPTSDVPDPALVDLDGFVYAAKAGFATRGAHIAGTPDLAPVFVEDMMTFWTSVMTPSTKSNAISPRISDHS